MSSVAESVAAKDKRRDIYEVNARLTGKEIVGAVAVKLFAPERHGFRNSPPPRRGGNDADEKREQRDHNIKFEATHQVDSR
jgi:hypothetical protein